MKTHSSYISQAINKKVDGYIHINRVPGNVPYETFHRFCSQFGKILKLSLLPSSSGEQHAYLRYSTKPEQDFAQSKLKELQGLRFVGINWNGSSDSLIQDEKDYRRVGTHHGGKVVERFLCSYCSTECNSVLQINQHIRKHRTFIDISDQASGSVAAINLQNGHAGKEATDEMNNDIDQRHTVQANSVLPAESFVSNEIPTNRLKDLALQKLVLESSLETCQSKLNIRKQIGLYTPELIKILEEELEIQRKLRMIEMEIVRLDVNYRNNSSLKSNMETSASTNIREDGNLMHASDDYDPDEIFYSDEET